MKGLKKREEKTLQMTHSRTAVPVPVNVVSVPKVHCMFFLD